MQNRNKKVVWFFSPRSSPPALWFCKTCLYWSWCACVLFIFNSGEGAGEYNTLYYFRAYLSMKMTFFFISKVTILYRWLFSNLGQEFTYLYNFLHLFCFVYVVLYVDLSHFFLVSADTIPVMSHKSYPLTVSKKMFKKKKLPTFHACVFCWN